MTNNDANSFFELEYGLSLNEYIAIDHGNKKANKKFYPKKVFPIDRVLLNCYFKREYGMSSDDFFKLDLSVQPINNSKKRKILKK